jgi:tetratricopeptide (TPR) repeat protein
MLEEGKRQFREGSYGKALISFEDSRRIRKESFEKMERTLIDLLSIPEVRRLGDSLGKLEAYISERNQAASASALRTLYYQVGKESLKDSSTEALKRIHGLKDYPEAEYWIGEVYLAEGEYPIALKQFLKVLDLSDRLDTPAFRTEVLYRIADIHAKRREYLEMEKRLQEIIAADELWNKDTESFIRAAMVRTLSDSGIDRFLTMYRYEYGVSEKAHRLLGVYYYTSGRHARSVEHLLFSFLIQNTTVLNYLSRVKPEYVFTVFGELSSSIKEFSGLVDYAREVEYFKTIYYLGASLFAVGKNNAALEIWRVLSVQANAGEWKGRAELQLRKPFIEPVAGKP